VYPAWPSSQLNRRRLARTHFFSLIGSPPVPSSTNSRIVPSMAGSFFLGRQSLLEQLLFELGEVGSRIPPEPQLGAATLWSPFKRSAQGSPSFDVRRTDVCPERRTLRGASPRRRPHPPSRPPHHRWGGGSFCAASTPLAVAYGAEVVLKEVVVGARQLGEAVAVETVPSNSSCSPSETKTPLPRGRLPLPCGWTSPY
jgi:hypothetical protein